MVAIHQVNTEADVVWVDGHSDYGHAFSVFWDRWGEEVTPRTSVLVLGDARNNYHASESWVLHEIRHRARRVSWLEPRTPRILGHGRLDSRRVRGALRRGGRVQQPAPARAFRLGARVTRDGRASVTESRPATSKGVVGGHEGCTGLSEHRSGHRPESLRERLGTTGELSEADALYSSVLPRAVETAQDDRTGGRRR